jgi:putative transposase
MNRLLSNCGLSQIKIKLQTISEDYGIKITYINPAYTSQECNRCSYTDKENRKTRENFKCLCCGHKSLADVNASKNIMSRAHDSWFTTNVYATKTHIKQHLLIKNKMFVDSNNSRLSKAMGRDS